jgi:hypothetical protein
LASTKPSIDFLAPSSVANSTKAKPIRRRKKMVLVFDYFGFCVLIKILTSIDFLAFSVANSTKAKPMGEKHTLIFGF